MSRSRLRLQIPPAWLGRSVCTPACSAWAPPAIGSLTHLGAPPLPIGLPIASAYQTPDGIPVHPGRTASCDPDPARIFLRSAAPDTVAAGSPAPPPRLLHPQMACFPSPRL